MGAQNTPMELSEIVLEAIQAAKPYVRHDRDCTARKGAHYGDEHCDCGMIAARSKVFEAEDAALLADGNGHYSEVQKAAVLGTAQKLECDLRIAAMEDQYAQASNACHDWLIANLGAQNAPAELHENMLLAKGRLSGAKAVFAVLQMGWE